MAYCGACGAELQLDDAFCRKCGTPVTRPDDGATRVMPAVQPGTPAEQFAPPRRQSGNSVAIVSAVAILLLAGIVMLALTQCRGGGGGVPVGSLPATAPPVLGTSGTTSASPAPTPAPGGSTTTPGGTPASTTTTSAPVTNPNDVTHQPTFITKSSKRADGTPLLTFDYVTWLTGAAAEKAAKAHGDTVENDYYVVNDNNKLRTFRLANDVEIIMHPSGDPAVSRQFTPDEFAALIKAGSANYSGQDYSWAKETVFWVTVKDGLVTRVEHQWVP